MRRPLIDSDEFKAGPGLESIDVAMVDGIWFERRFRQQFAASELDFVSMCYGSLLGRPPEPPLIDRISREGLIIEDRVGFVEQMIQSREFQARAAPPRVDITSLRRVSDGASIL